MQLYLLNKSSAENPPLETKVIKKHKRKRKPNKSKILNIDEIKVLKPKKFRERKSRPYYKKVWAQTELSAPFLKDIELRGWKGKHIEHIVPISYGEKHNIPPCLIGSIENLIMLDRVDNMRKGRRLTSESISLLKKWGYEIPKH